MVSWPLEHHATPFCPTSTLPSVNTQVDQVVALAYGTAGERHTQDRRALFSRVCAALLVHNTLKELAILGGLFLRVLSNLENPTLQRHWGVDMDEAGTIMDSPDVQAA